MENNNSNRVKAVKVSEIPVKTGLSGVFKEAKTLKGKFGDNMVYVFTNPDSEVWGCKSLNEQMADVTPGTKIKIKNLGEEEFTTKTGKTGKKYNVKVVELE